MNTYQIIETAKTELAEVANSIAAIRQRLSLIGGANA